MNALVFAAVVAASNTVATLSPVVVEASRLEQSRSDIASHIEVVGKEEIESSGAQNTVELLEKRANLFVRKVNSNPAQAQISMRGYGAAGFGRVKILVDGEELNNADMSPQNLMRVPVRSIQRVEVLHGPQTVLHGGDSSAGVINIVSDTEEVGRKSEIEFHGGNLGAVGFHFGTRGRDAASTPGAASAISYFADFDFDRADGWRKNSWYELWSVKGGIKQSFDDGSWWAAKAFYADSGYGLPGGLYTGGSYGRWQDRARAAEDEESKARNNVYGVNLSGKLVINDENSLSSELSFRDRKSFSYGYLDYDVYTLACKLKYANTTAISGFKNRFDLGTDLKYDVIFADAYNEDTSFGGDNDYSRFTGAVFLRDEFWVYEGVSLFAGARGEWFKSRDVYDLRYEDGTVAMTKGAVAGEVGVNWRPLDGMKVFAKWSRFYHAPLADEMFSSYGIPNMSLKPEEGHNSELGFDWSFGGDFNFNFTGFHAELDDEIMYLNYENCNAPDHTARSGFETSFTWSREKVGGAGLMYTYVYSRFTEGDYTGNDVPMVPRQQLRLFGEYYPVDGLAVHGGYRFVGVQRFGSDFANEGGALPAYGIFDAGVRVMPSWRWLDGFTFAFTVDNLFDRRYCDYGEYFGSHYVYPACGRSFLFTVRYEF